METKQIKFFFEKKDFEQILAGLDLLMKQTKDENEYKEIVNVYEHINEDYEELLEQIEVEENENNNN